MRKDAIVADQAAEAVGADESIPVVWVGGGSVSAVWAVSAFEEGAAGTHEVRIET